MSAVAERPTKAQRIRSDAEAIEVAAAYAWRIGPGAIERDRERAAADR